MPGLGNYINKAAEAHDLDSRIVAAIVHVESKGEPWSSRYEEGFYKRYVEGRHLIHYVPDQNVCSNRTERNHRATSWGLMHIMGLTARERGFHGLLTRLLDPQVNLLVGCEFLSSLFALPGLTEHHVYLRWNGGSDLSYPMKVFAAKEDPELEKYFL